MSILLLLIPITLILSLAGLGAFLWSIKTKQYDDLEGAANRILFDEDKNDQKNDFLPKENHKENKKS